jgi:transcriptional regulator with XRE-family HTH domain
MGVTKYAVQHWEHGVNPVPAWAVKLLEALIWLKVTESKLAELGVTPPRLEAERGR